tara:strand:+ start:3438 stop:3923 length:486 start_codon:yes stop_codon:yes gene_type:complete
MKLEFKNIKYYASMSEETDCYEAILYVDGKRLGRVHNDGHGGCDHHDFSWKEYERVNEWCKENLPKWKWICEHDNTETENDTDLEIWCHDQVTNHLLQKELKRHLKKLFVMETDKQFYSYKVKWSDVTSIALDSWKEKNPSAIVLNALPFDEALNLYRQHI